MSAEIRPRFESSKPRVYVNTDLLGSRIQGLINGGCDRKIMVDVSSRDVGSVRCEWRVDIPFREPEIYLVLGRIVAQTNAIYSEHVRRGTMPAREYTVKVWPEQKHGQPIIGSFD